MQDLIEKLRKTGRLDKMIASKNSSSMWKSTQSSGIDPEVKVYGKIDYRFKDGSKQRIPVEIVGYDESTSSFLLVNKELGVNTMRPRIYIELADD